MIPLPTNIVSDGWYVGLVAGGPADPHQRRFDSEEAAATHLGLLAEGADPFGVLEGKWYLDPPWSEDGWQPEGLPIQP